jgi:hypothetical protein
MNLTQHFTSELDARAVADWFNYALESHVADAVSLFRPVQSMSDNIYGKTQTAGTLIQHE